jgi:hypothetical protein
LASQTGTSVGQARDTLDTGQRLEQHPEIADAARAGELSATQTAMICAGANADPESAARLIETAKRSSVAELRDEVARTKAAAATDLEARRQEIRARRRLRAWTDLEGVWQLRASGNVEDGAQIMAALTSISNDLFHAARCQGRREPPEAYAFDALVQLATEATSGDPADRGAETTADAGTDNGDSDAPDSDPADRPGSPPPGADTSHPPAAPESEPSPSRLPRRRRHRRGAPVKLLVRIDYDTWLRGVPLPGETCELAGYGPVPVSVVDDLVARGDPFVAAILTRGQTLVGVAHLGRQPTATQQTALEWLYPTCAAEGCPVQARLQRDHRIDWAKTHHTMLDELDLLCGHHHDLKTRANWALVPGVGKRPFVPPTDPRHPDHHRHPCAT